MLIILLRMCFASEFPEKKLKKPKNNIKWYLLVDFQVLRSLQRIKVNQNKTRDPIKSCVCPLVISSWFPLKQIRTGNCKINGIISLKN